MLIIIRPVNAKMLRSHLDKHLHKLGKRLLG